MIQKKWNKEIKRSKYTRIPVVVLVVALLGTFLPGWLLVGRSRGEMNLVEGVPVEYYSPANLAVARNASANLDTYRKLQLITGRWASEPGEAEAMEKSMEDYEAVKVAWQQVEVLYQSKVYPESILPDYENWYNWEAELCKVLDATFHTYAAYYWKMTFVKYDDSEKHCIYMTEDGTVFLAEVWKESGIKEGSISTISQRDLTAEYRLREMNTNKLSKEQSIAAYLAFADVDAAGLHWMSLSELQVEEKKYHVLQLDSKKRYVYSLQPAN